MNIDIDNFVAPAVADDNGGARPVNTALGNIQSTLGNIWSALGKFQLASAVFVALVPHDIYIVPGTDTGDDRS
jgi:hypothetical protein